MGGSSSSSGHRRGLKPNWDMRLRLGTAMGSMMRTTSTSRKTVVIVSSFQAKEKQIYFSSCSQANRKLGKHTAPSHHVSHMAYTASACRISGPLLHASVCGFPSSRRLFPSRLLPCSSVGTGHKTSLVVISITQRLHRRHLLLPQYPLQANHCHPVHHQLQRPLPPPPL